MWESREKFNNSPDYTKRSIGYTTVLNESSKPSTWYELFYVTCSFLPLNIIQVTNRQNSIHRQYENVPSFSPPSKRLGLLAWDWRYPKTVRICAWTNVLKGDYSKCDRYSLHCRIIILWLRNQRQDKHDFVVNWTGNRSWYMVIFIFFASKKACQTIPMNFRTYERKMSS